MAAAAIVYAFVGECSFSVVGIGQYYYDIRFMAAAAIVCAFVGECSFTLVGIGQYYYVIRFMHCLCICR